MDQEERLPLTEVTPETGLTEQQVQHRLTIGQGNGMPQGAGLTEGQIILRNVVTFFNLVFLVLAVVLVIGGSSIKNMTFLVVVVTNTVIGCVQEIRSKRAVDRLTLVAAQQIRTMRDGKLVSVRSDLLVRDDLVEFGPGDQICADGIVRSGGLQVNEALITGEADAISKEPGDELKSGSFVITGRARVQLTRVGGESFASRLAMEAKANPHAAKSEMMRSLDRLIRVVGLALIPLGAVLFYQEYQVLELGMRESTEATVAALIGMIPEGLYLLTSIAMAASAMKLTKRRVLVQDLNCIETLARVDVLCVDKTGTITEPKMELDNIIPLTDDPPEHLERVLKALYADTEADNDTARAVQELFDSSSGWECTRRIPFSSEFKWSGGVFRGQGAYLAGAPEMILGSRYAAMKDKIEPWTATGYRVLLVCAYNGELEPGRLLPDLVIPMALVLLTNRIRSEAADTFRFFAQQGVTIKVISGDSPVTVSAVAARAGIANADRYIDTAELESVEDYLDAVEQYTVFGRVTPDQKKLLIKALKQRRHTVAMTGDGVNDVLAMREADCGIAMASGAQAASQVAQLVLLDSDFAAMPGIVGEGRRVINNIQRAATLFLVKNIFSLGLSVLSFFTNWPYPLVPLHLSVISSLTIGVPSFFLAMEPNYERVSGHFLRGVLRRAFPGGLTNIFVVLMAQAFMTVFDLSLEETSTVCAAILGVVGLQVLFQVCKPFDKFRVAIWWAMAVGLAVCFTLFNGFLDLRTGSIQTTLVMFTLIIMSPTVFFAMQRIFDWGDKAAVWIRGRLRRR